MKNFIIKTLLLILIAIAIAIVVYYFHQTDPGNFSVTVPFLGYNVSTTFVVAVLVLLAVYFVWQFVLGLVKKVFNIPQGLKARRLAKKSLTEKQSVQEGYLAELAGDWVTAERAYCKAGKDSEMSIMQMIGSAVAAHHQNKPARRDEYLDRAAECEDADLALISVQKVSFLQDDGEFEVASTVLEEALSAFPRNPLLLELQVDQLVDEAAWTKLFPLLEDKLLQKQIGNAEVEQLRLEATTGRMQELAEEGDAVKLESYFSSLKRSIRETQPVMLAYIDGLIAAGEDRAAATLLEQSMKKDFMQPCLERYSQLDIDLDKQIKSLEGISSAQTTLNEPLELLLAQKYLDKQLYGQAKVHISKLLEEGASPKAHLMMATVLEELGEEGSEQHYRDGLSLV